MFPLYKIDMSTYHLNEVSSFMWTAPWFSWADSKCVFEDIGELILNNDNPWGSVIIYISEIEKCRKWNYDKDSILNSFFSNIMQYLNEPIHKFKGWNKRTQTASINICNAIIILDWNLYSDKKLECSKKIWFTDEDLKKQDEENFSKNNKLTKEKFLDFLKKEIPMSAYSRICYSPHSIIYFKDLGNSQDEIKMKIFQMEYDNLLESFKQRYKEHSHIFLKYESEEIKKELYDNMLLTLDPDTGIRGLKNFIDYEIKNKIINELIIPNLKISKPKNLNKKEKQNETIFSLNR